ncbi:hypothetical protein HMPREF9445_01598 [Bacteroides clarus YIT 12056]|uniref:Uncharacterized protein n=1 Tax=Bacteroides clarus YIT 12056 TaxID=762984 RepID=A0ABN0CP24_9BACE|nr:hypothetical protein HMPREF9445_01598 [Bacteroides clarus YIT 12056]
MPLLKHVVGGMCLACPFCVPARYPKMYRVSENGHSSFLF